jgi:hypothetical protein
MDVYQLIKAVGGEIVRNKARVRRGNDYVVIGILTEDGMIFTKDGAALKARYESTGSIEAPAEEDAEAATEEKPVVKAKPKKATKAVAEEPAPEPEVDTADEPNAN